MSSALRGVAAIVSSQMKVPGSAPYTHCRSHCINLSVASACKEHHIRRFMDDLTSLATFLQTPQNDNNTSRNSLLNIENNLMFLMI